jgi:agmatinase
MLLYTRNHLKFALSLDKDYLKDKSVINTGKDIKNVEFGILGVPFDSTTTYKPGARFGPTFIREASYNFEKYNIILNKMLDVSVNDFGDVEVIPGNFEKTSLNIESTISELLDDHIVPITIGGEHTLSYSIIKSFETEKINIIHFDAHMDIRDRFMDEKFSHATVMRRIFDLNPKRIIQIGIRSCSFEELSFSKENQINYFTPQEVNEDIKAVEKTIRDLKGPVYVTVDMDVFDPAYAPSVGNPSPCGLNPFQVERLIYYLKKKELIGFDLMEVASTHIGDITSINAAKVIYDFLYLH